MIWGTKNKIKKPWRITWFWFAWRPVKLLDGRWVWWQKVEKFYVRYTGRDWITRYLEIEKAEE